MALLAFFYTIQILLFLFLVNSSSTRKRRSHQVKIAPDRIACPGVNVINQTSRKVYLNASNTR